MIHVEGLCKQFGPSVAVRDVSFSVERGEVLGLLGTNGAGKTTIMRVLTGYFPPTRGRARVAGFDVTEEPEEVKRRIGYLPENAPLYREMKVQPLLRFVAEIKGLSGRRRNESADAALEAAGLSEVANRLIGNLSRGYRQRVGLAQAMVGDPEVLILDEPSAGLDPSQVTEFRALIRSMAGRRTVILSTHILPEVSAVCGKVVIIHRGRMVAWGAPRQLHTQLKAPGRVDVSIGGAESGAAAVLLKSLPGVEAVCEYETPEGDSQVISFALKARGGGCAPAVARAVVEKGWRLEALHESGDNLEDIFMRVISEKSGAPDGEAAP